MQSTMSHLSRPRGSSAAGVVRVVLLASLVGLMLPTLLGLLWDIMKPTPAGSWVQLPYVYFGFLLGLVGAPVAGVGALLVMGLRALFR
jgi:hypothetical protein